MKALKYVCMLAVAVVIASCEGEGLDNAPISSERYISFASGSAATPEGSAYTLPIYRSTGDLSGTASVSYTVNAVYASDSDFHNAGDDASGALDLSGASGSGSFAANSAVVNVVIVSLQDEIAAGDVTVTVTVTDTDDASLQVGRPLGAPTNDVFTLTVVDDDCPISLDADWAGTYDASDLFIGGGNAGIGLVDFGLLGGTVTFEADPTDPLGLTGIFSNASGPNIAAPITVVFETCPQLVTHTGYDLTPGGLGNAIGGPGGGDFDPSTFTVRLETDALGPYGGPHELVFTKQ